MQAPVRLASSGTPVFRPKQQWAPCGVVNRARAAGVAPPACSTSAGCGGGDRLELELRAHAVLKECLWEARRDRMRRPPAGAVRRYEVVRVELAQRGARRLDDRLECTAAQVKAADDRMDVVLPRELSDVAEDVDNARVAAAGQDDKPMASDECHERLVVEDQRIGLPGSVPVRLMDREPSLEIGGAVHL